MKALEILKKHLVNIEGTASIATIEICQLQKAITELGQLEAQIAELQKSKTCNDGDIHIDKEDVKGDFEVTAFHDMGCSYIDGGAYQVMQCGCQCGADISLDPDTVTYPLGDRLMVPKKYRVLIVDRYEPK